MRHIASMRDLEQFGIQLLTGEADALGYRILCDLTESAADLVAETYGLVGRQAFPPAWNSRGVACAMLSHNAYRDIGPIALIKAGCHTVFDTENGTIFGLENDESIDFGEMTWDDAKNEAVQVRGPRYSEGGRDDMPWPVSCYGKPQRKYRFGSGPHVGTRNVHAMSGRVV